MYMITERLFSYYSNEVVIWLRLRRQGRVHFISEPRCIVVGMIYWNSAGQVRDAKAIMCCNNIRMTETYADRIYEIVDHWTPQRTKVQYIS